MREDLSADAARLAAAEQQALDGHRTQSMVGRLVFLICALALALAVVGLWVPDRRRVV